MFILVGDSVIWKLAWSKSVPDWIMLCRAIIKTPKLYQVPVDLILLTPEEYDKETSIRMSFIRNGVNIPVPA